MPPRQIPINSRNRGNAPTPPPWQSSLDLVFSFSRSQAFFGENLPTSPSFVQRYTVPPAGSEEHTADEAATGATSTDDDTEGYDTGGDDAASGFGEDSDSVNPNFGWDLGSSVGSAARGAGSVRGGGGISSRSSGVSTAPRVASNARSAGGPRLPSNAPHLSKKASKLSQMSARPIGENTPLIAANRRPIVEPKGQSTFGQTLFNAVNALIGVGLLAVPLSFAYAGWILGTFLLLFCAFVTNYTAKMLAKMMATDPELQTYADVLIKAYGPTLRPIIYCLFALELGALSIALVVLFADSMSVLVPALSPTAFKLIGLAIVLPTTYLPLRLLSITSLLGIFTSFVLLAAVVFDGLWKTSEGPGSLWHPAHTSLGPAWIHVPLSLGLLMSGFSGHAIMPSLYRDMQDPSQFPRMINWAYVITCGVSFIMGIAGYLMFGDDVSSEITQDMLSATGYPKVLNTIAMSMVACNPVVKFALASRPLVATVEHLLASWLPMSEQNRQALQESAILTNNSMLSQSRANSTIYGNSGLSWGPRGAEASAVPSYVRGGREAPASSLSAPLESDYLTQDHSEEVPTPPTPPRVRLFQHLSAFVVRPGLTSFIVFLAIIIPDFARVLAFLGNASAFVICCIGPIGAYLIFSSPQFKFLYSPKQLITIHTPERLFCLSLLVFSIVCACVGTVWSFIPTA